MYNVHVHIMGLYGLFRIQLGYIRIILSCILFKKTDFILYESTKYNPKYFYVSLFDFKNDCDYTHRIAEEINCKKLKKKKTMIIIRIKKIEKNIYSS